MKLTDILFNSLNKDKKSLEGLSISGLACDSRKVLPGDAFFAIKGEKVNGINFCRQAEQNGAKAIISDFYDIKKLKEFGLTVPVIQVENVRYELSFAANKWFGPQPKEIIAVTGTNGKTSVANFLKQIWDSIGISCASIGTLGVEGFLDHNYEMTTPDPISLHKCLSDMRKHGISHVVLEASSHGLLQSRLDNIKITKRAFTNLSRDHLDYHFNLDNYFLAKARLFLNSESFQGPALINLDHYYGRLMKLVAENNGLKVFSVGKLLGCDFRLENQLVQSNGQLISVSYSNRTYKSNLKLMGSFQAENALMAAALAVMSGLTPNDVFSALSNLSPAKGRLEMVKEMKNGAKIFVDYAHSPEALRQVLLALKPHTLGSLSLVFGAGGDRDKGKRKIMGKVANKYADKVFITDDNPRNEPADHIRDDIKTGCPKGIDISDRAEAIFRAVSDLEAGDNLIIAGKGHETGQIIGNAIYPFDDTEQVSMSVEILDKEHH